MFSTSVIKLGKQCHQCCRFGTNIASITLADEAVHLKDSLPGRGFFSRTIIPLSPHKMIARSSSTNSQSVNKDEIEKFERMSSNWWNDSTGQMRELHSMNRLRVPFIRDGLLQRHQNGRNADVPKPLEGLQILDVGCGGGILCEPLGRLGATVKGIDPGKANISNAEGHLPDALKDRVSYECISLEELAEKHQGSLNFDAVVISEVIEHVEKPDEFIRSATEVLKPQGSLFMTTVNRTFESWMGAIVAWEYLLRKLPVGTHDWKRFLTPEEVDKMLKLGGFRTVLIHGMCYNPVSDSWKWSKNRAINYAVHAVKES